MPQSALQSAQVAKRKTVSLCLKHGNRAIYTSRGLWSGSIMSSITVNDKNHPLGERYLTVYPVAAVSGSAVSNRHHSLGLAATRIVNNLNLTRETPSGSAGASYASRLEICTVFSAKQIILSGGTGCCCNTPHHNSDLRSSSPSRNRCRWFKNGDLPGERLGGKRSLLWDGSVFFSGCGLRGWKKQNKTPCPEKSMT